LKIISDWYFFKDAVIRALGPAIQETEKSKRRKTIHKVNRTAVFPTSAFNLINLIIARHVLLIDLIS